MNEPLTDEQLKHLRDSYAWERYDTRREVTLAVRSLLDEIVRLKAREAELVAEVEAIKDENIGRMGW